MTLGFSVEALLPHARLSGPLRMGLHRLSEEDWLQSSPDVALRQAAFDEFPQAVQVLPEAEDAEAELAAMVGISGGLEDAARDIWEDLCILTKAEADAPYRLTAGAVAFPTDWHLSDKMGLGLTDVHAPIHGYAEQLAIGVDHFMTTLRPDQIFGRTNCFIVGNSDLRYLPPASPEARFAGLSAENAGQRLYIRCERQSLRRLPQTGAILFTIGVYVEALGMLSKEALAKVSSAFTDASQGEHDRRAAPFYAPILADYCTQKCQEE
ncbi:heme-dependent oxidative N-demethylase subunit alpha family protein [Sphingorhabdus arenilitoris]|uniref:Heme-dependent oxidative N-demethylase subunit alpha family protein n=1 Tax=Sphingorhabdus arenilitoris TaxID=1490041 RepID=A0ABV8RHH8_9SPHN